ncbi:MAG: gamma-glutamyl-gamma-aminobutyrate hydrolase family protein [Kiritimatiellales bacterium]|nr:gamma-glutamyl-gamma-aminobutyrate hydrolase family protein [Kiritimatiellota bacterium]MBL7016555.1 gamma-glutamyl-gamma-aminobutyrate hydrolase family protein [Kiritimatiellales bacterium]
MNIHWLQHVEFEGLGCIEPWLEEHGHDVSCTRFWAGEELPTTCDVDGLIVMGGPMGVTDHAEFPWLAVEKAFIKEIIAHNKPVLGICLGAQLIADVLGAKVWPAKNKEIGFFPIFENENLKADAVGFKPWENQTVFHWHGDTFGIPDGAVRLASSEATENQAFLYKDNVLALQFHLETTQESLLQLYENAADEITAAPFIQPLEAMRPFFPMLGKCNDLMFELLGRLFASP